MTRHLTLPAAATAAALFASGLAGPVQAADYDTGSSYESYESYSAVEDDGDHPRWADHRERVSVVLADRGYVDWNDDVGWDDGYWVVERARRDDGSYHRLRVHPESLDLVEVGVGLD